MKKAKKMLAVWLSAALLLTLAPLSALAAQQGSAKEQSWDVSRSKTATNLDQAYRSQVTLSLPSHEEKLVTDVVFVLDESSCSEPVKAEVAQMLQALYAQAEETGAVIKVGAVQFRGEVTSLPLTEITADTKDDVADFMGRRPATGGSNLSASLLAGENMLDADAAVSRDRKYLILVSDGITYIWDDADTGAQENYGVNFANADAPHTPMLASPDGWDVKHGSGYVPESWPAWLNETKALYQKTTADKASLYVRGADISGDPFVSYDEKASYASTVDLALYASYQAYQRIAAKYPHTYAVMSGVQSEMALYPFGPSFMRFLSGGAQASFDGILNEILYLVDAGSYVEDFMGYVQDEYNFDFVNDAAALSLSVGQERYEAVRLADNEYGFKPLPDGGYAHTLRYTPGNLADTEHFTWTIHEPVTNFAPVQLTYTVQLTNPKTQAGTYGAYDADGSQGYAGLYTNNSAVLTPVDSNGVQGAAQPFAKPTVSYTVEEQSVPSPSPEQTAVPSSPAASAAPTPTPASPQTGDNSSPGVWAALLSLAAIGAVSTACLAYRKRKSA